MKNYRFLIATVIASVLSQGLWAQDAVYYIRSIEYRIDGSTRVFALRNAGEFVEGIELPTAAALERYLAEKRQLLANQRVLDSAEILHTLADPEADGRIPVDLTVSVTDTWNIIALPYFKYDSNDGLELTAKGRNYNFLGTMQPLRVDLGFQIDQEAFQNARWREGAFFAEIDSNTPFKLFGYNWEADFDHYLGYTSKYGFEYENSTGLSLRYPLGSTTLVVGAFQGISVNEKNSKAYAELTGENRFEDGWYLSNWLSADWEIPTGLELDGFGMLKYIPGAEFKVKYRPGGDIGDERRGPTATFRQALAFGRVNWVGNYRKGLEVEAVNENEYNLHAADWNRSMKAEAAGHYPLSRFFGLSGRLVGTYYLDDPNDKGASPLRGILDDAVVAEYGVYLNADVPIRVIRFVPSQWFGRRKLRIFDFEQQWTPFVDAALVKDGVNGRSFVPEDILVSGGLEVVTFPLFMRSLFIRVSVGLDLRSLYENRSIPRGDGREIFIGLGHHY